MRRTQYQYDDVEHHVGKEIGTSEWLKIDQPRIDQFASCTGDHQWIHVDPERAAQESPFGSTIAHGFLVLSLLAKWNFESGGIPSDAATAVNYGSNKVRFMSPVLAGKRVRNRMKLIDCQDKGARKLLTIENVVEIEGSEKPALIADTLVLVQQPKS